jgi:hypothetical protein
MCIVAKYQINLHSLQNRLEKFVKGNHIQYIDQSVPGVYFSLIPTDMVGSSLIGWLKI